MKNKERKRVRKLTSETSTFLTVICHGFVDLAKHLLAAGNDYVIFGWFTTDPLEKYFGKLRQGSGGTYFITAQSAIEKIRIHRAKLATQLNVEFEGDSTHACSFCQNVLNEAECEIMDNLVSLEENINEDTIFGMVYIAGYVEHKNGCKNDDDTKFYHGKYGLYLDELNRGKLCIPHDGTVQWSLFCFILFSSIERDMCRTFLIQSFQLIADKYNFSIDKGHCQTLANIFMKNMALFNTPRCSSETKLKAIKLSSNQ